MTEESKVVEVLNQLHADRRDLIGVIEKNNEVSVRPRRVYLVGHCHRRHHARSLLACSVLESRFKMLMP